MSRRVAATLCGAVMIFWLFALAGGSAAGAGVHAGAAQAAQPVAAAAMTQAEQLAQTEPGFDVAEAAQNGPAASGAPGIAAPQNTAPDNAGTAAPDTAQPSLDLPCKAAILIDEQSGEILYEMNADERRPIASITKVMTLLLTFEAIHAGKIDYTDVVPISEHAYSMGGSQIWLEPGEIFTLDELLKAICVSSANDAAVVVAEYVGGSEPAFVSQMNARAAELGMTNTTFQNACGLDAPNHLSSARDVALMSREILTECPEVLKYTGIWMDSLRNGTTQLINTNKLLKHYNGINGLKTGTTGGAGVCISASAERDGLSLIAVVLGSESSGDRFKSATALLDYGFSNYEAAAVPALQNAPLTCEVRGGDVASVELDYSAVPASLLLKKGQGKELTAQLTVEEQCRAPIEAGAPLGSVKVYSGNQLIGEYPVTAAQSAARLSFSTALRLMLEKLAQP